MRNIHLALIFFFICIFSMGSYAQMPILPLDTTIRKAVDFNLTDLTGQDIKSEDLKGNIVVINFWGINCKPCIQEIPELNNITNEFGKRQVHFIGITGDSKDDLVHFLKENPFKYQICSTTDYQKLLIDFNKFPAVPIHFIINKDWQIIYRYVGKLNEKSLIHFKQTLDKLLK